MNDETDGGNDSNKDVNDITERSYKSTSKGEAILKDIQGNCYVEVMKEWSLCILHRLRPYAEAILWYTAQPYFVSGVDDSNKQTPTIEEVTEETTKSSIVPITKLYCRNKLVSSTNWTADK